MKQQVNILDATPSKRLYMSIIADYDVHKSICELIDNALDIWVTNGCQSTLQVDITLDKDQQRIHVSDNAGGIDESNLSFVVGPGHTGNLETQPTIGIFGVGTKRAVVALAQEVRIRTMQRGKTYEVDFDDDWLKQDGNWELPYYEVDNIPPGTTQIELTKLRRPLSDDTISQLTKHLGATYAKFLKKRKVRICLNGDPIPPVIFEDWSYPPQYEPRIYTGTIKAQDGNSVEIEAVAGLATESSPAGGEYGVYFYCNDRLVARGLKTIDVGFTTGLAGKPHADISLARVIISLNGEARLMPWNSSKSDINTSHEVFVALRQWLLQVVKDYTSLSRRLSKFEGGWPEQVFKYKTGQAKQVRVDDFPTVKTSYLPPMPTARQQYSRLAFQKNQALLQRKPWTIGIYESIVAVDWVLGKRFEQKNRIALLLLDSTLEIAFKEYLVNESKAHYPDAKLVSLFEKRHLVEDEVKKYLKAPNKDWGKIKHYYRKRCQLVHQRASVAVSDQEVNDFRTTVERMLTRMFKLKFPKVAS